MRRIDRSKPEGFAAYEDANERLIAAVGLAVDDVEERDARLSVGLRAALDFLAASPALAWQLLVEPLVAAGPARLEYERSLLRLAALLRSLHAGSGGSAGISEEAARLLAGGLASHLSGRVLAGETGDLPESHDLLLGYLLAASPTIAVAERRPARV